MVNRNISKLRKDALQIFKAAISENRAEKIIEEKVKLKGDQLSINLVKSSLREEVFVKGKQFNKINKKTYNLAKFKKIIVIGAGKASIYMAKAMEEILADRITKGLIITKYNHLARLKKIKFIEAGHPIPDKNAIFGAKKIKKLLNSAGKEDLVINLISGGGSSLMTLPVKGIYLKDIQKLTKLLLFSGATIHEINTIRKHLSQVKGGNLARLIYPAQSINLIISDVINNDLDVIASGPTVPDSSTFKQALNILKKYKLFNKVSKNILKHLQEGVRSKILETPKKNDLIFKKVYNLIVGSNRLVLEEARKKAQQLGYQTKIFSYALKGEARDVAKDQVNQFKKFLDLKTKKQSQPICLISGGETTVTIKGKGKGGRCQEFALASAIEISKKENLVVLACGTDGTDGPTEAAGAIADGQTITKALKKHLNPEKYLTNNNSYYFFKKLGDLVITGPTHTNVMDLYLILSV